MSYESYKNNQIKKRKLQHDKDKNCPCTLQEICNWFYPDKPAIQYYDLEEIKIISYNELQAAKKTVSDCLECIHYPEFIGINFDILEYCVPSLMLGILDSGNAFFNVPSDPLTYKEIFTSAHVKYIFTKHVTSNTEIICQFSIHEQSLYLTKFINIQESTANNRKWYHFAYAIATSGSTGTPKVVKVFHSCILPNITDLKRILDITISDKIAQLTNFTFDPSIIEIFLSFSCAATLFMVSKSLKNEADRLLEKIFYTQVTVLQITPSLLFHMWPSERLKKTIFNKDSHLRVLLLGGEPFPSMKVLLEASHPQNITRVFNIYGITEISCWSSINEIVKNNGIDESYLGKPLSNTIFQIRNDNNKVITEGKGILYIGSSSRTCVVGNEEENLNKLIFHDTGDVVSIDDQGRIFYKGRRNNVIKRLGNKINLRKLERTVAQLSFVQNCVAHWDVERHKLYLCFSANTTVNSSNLRSDIISHLKILPAIYMPDKIITVERFDFTTSGKICLTSLRKICQDSEREIRYNTNLHANVSEIFGDFWHIQCKDVGFLTSGGSSLTAIQISNAAVEAFNNDFPELIGMLLKDVTFNECVNYIRNTLSRDWSNNDNHFDVSVNDDLSQKDSNTIKQSIEELCSNDFPLSINQNNSYQYKCKGSIYGNALTQEQSDRSLLTSISNIEVLATYNLRKCVDASPTVYCSKTDLFATVGSHSGVICTVNLLDTNSKPYKVKLPDRIEASVLVLTDFRGIVGCYDGYIYCIHLKTGKTIWKYRTHDMVKCTAITCMLKNRIFVGSYDQHVYCLSIKDGTLIWKTRASKSGICATGCLYPQMISVLFATLDGTCMALQQFSGGVTWKRKLQEPIFVAPKVLQNGHVLFCSVKGNVYCFEIETNYLVWRYEAYYDVFSYPVISSSDCMNSGEHIILATAKRLYCLETPRAKMKEKEPILKYTLNFDSSPLFATPWCENGYMFVTCTDGTFQVFDLSKGKLLASKKLPGETFSSPVIHNNLAVLGCRDNNFYILKLS